MLQKYTLVSSVAGLLLEGVVLRLQAGLRWLEACARYWFPWPYSLSSPRASSTDAAPAGCG